MTDQVSPPHTPDNQEQSILSPAHSPFREGDDIESDGSDDFLSVSEFIEENEKDNSWASDDKILCLNSKLLNLYNDLQGRQDQDIFQIEKHVIPTQIERTLRFIASSFPSRSFLSFNPYVEWLKSYFDCFGDTEAESIYISESRPFYLCADEFTSLHSDWEDELANMCRESALLLFNTLPKHDTSSSFLEFCQHIQLIRLLIRDSFLGSAQPVFFESFDYKCYIVCGESSYQRKFVLPFLSQKIIKLNQVNANLQDMVFAIQSLTRHPKNYLFLWKECGSSNENFSVIKSLNLCEPDSYYKFIANLTEFFYVNKLLPLQQQIYNCKKSQDINIMKISASLSREPTLLFYLIQELQKRQSNREIESLEADPNSKRPYIKISKYWKNRKFGSSKKVESSKICQRPQEVNIMKTSASLNRDQPLVSRKIQKRPKKDCDSAVFPPADGSNVKRQYRKKAEYWKNRKNPILQEIVEYSQELMRESQTNFRNF